jgi:hypothetical protein
VTNAKDVKLEDTALRVYLYVAKTRRPVGPRDVMRGVQLSSPSVAYRHLQNLESSGLLTKNDYGEYILGRKAHVSGYHWIGRTLLPNLMFYFYFFLGLFLTEIIVLAIHYSVENYTNKVFFALGFTITGIAMFFFLLEALRLLRKIK